MSENIRTEIRGNELIIKVDISPQTIDKAEMTSSGKNKLIASSRGSLDAGNGIRIGLNVYAKP